VPATTLPTINTLIDVVLHDGDVFESRVENVAGKRLIVAAPFGVAAVDLPRPGALLEVAWITEQARQAVETRLRAIGQDQPPRWELEVTGSVHLQTRRNYVRGGGGEIAKVVVDGETLVARVMDLSEGGVRLRVADDRFVKDAEVDLVLTLNGDRLPLSGTVLFVRVHPETESYDVIITYMPTEAVSRAIRSYVMHREMEARRRVRDSVANAG
jgi:hypothetical protein